MKKKDQPFFRDKIFHEIIIAGRFKRQYIKMLMKILKFIVMYKNVDENSEICLQKSCVIKKF